MNIDIYKDAIQNIWIHTLRYVVPVLCGCIVLIAFALYGAIKKLFDKAAVICLIAVALVVMIWPIAEIAVLSSEIRNNDFEVYCGDFKYMETGSGDLNVLRKPDGSAIRVNGVRLKSISYLDIGSGSYSGYLLYGKKTGWVIAYSATPFEWYDSD